MEAVPRLPMLSCELKVSPSNAEFGPALKKYIREHYNEDPESYNKEIKDLESLRQSAIKVPHDFTGCSTLKRYYSQLHCLQGRFVMAEDGPACVPFTWSDIYSGMVFNITDIKYEQACILYNIGALHSELGAMDSRVSAEGMKIACTHFQCAAWAFQHLRENFPQPKGTDMSHDLLTFFINIMLAQAQECILEKSMLDSRKSSITAKVAAQVVEYYQTALTTLLSGNANVENGGILDVIGSKLFKTWKKFVEFKMAYYSSISNLYMGNQAEEQQKMGDRVAWFTLALDKLNEAIKLAKTAERDDLSEALIFTMDVIGNKHNTAKKENDFVYHEKVPTLESLPEVKGASLVKGIPFSTTDPDVCGPDIFVRLVPMKAHEASSVYSEEKAKLLRSIAAKVEEKDQELMTYLSSLQLDQTSLNPQTDKIPQELLEKCAAMSVRQNVIEDVMLLLKALSDLSQEVEDALAQTVALLEQDKQKEQLHQDSFGKRAPSMIIVELRKECSKYEEAHKRAKESNSKLEKILTDHIDNLKLLCGNIDDLKKSLPSISFMNTTGDGDLVQELKRILDKVEEMRQQRQMLESQLRDALQNDDITKRLVMQDKNADFQVVYEEELKKHNQQISLLEQNLAAQDNILHALTQANAHYAGTRKQTLEILSRREAMILSMINSYDSYEDIVAKAQKGLEFYRKLQTNVSRLLTRARSVTKVQDEERAQIVEAQTRKAGRSAELKSNITGTSVPKLKDYLPYMTSRSGGTAFATGAYSQPSVPLASDISASHTSVQYPIASVSTYPNVPENVSTTTSTKLVADQLPYQEQGLINSVSSVSTIGIRPTPVGSEQTTTTRCTSTTYTDSYTVNAINKPIPSDQCYNQQFQPFNYAQQYSQQSIPNSSQFSGYSYSGVNQQPLHNLPQQQLLSQTQLSQTNQSRENFSLPQHYIPSNEINKYEISKHTNYYPSPCSPSQQTQTVSHNQLQYPAHYMQQLQYPMQQIQTSVSPHSQYPAQPTQSSMNLQSQYPAQPVQASVNLQSQYPAQPVQTSVNLQSQYPVQPVQTNANIQSQYPISHAQSSATVQQYPAQYLQNTSNIQYPTQQTTSTSNVQNQTYHVSNNYSPHTDYSQINSQTNTSQPCSYTVNQVIDQTKSTHQSWQTSAITPICYGYPSNYQQLDSDSQAAIGQTAPTYCYSSTQVSSSIGQQKEEKIENQHFSDNSNIQMSNYGQQNYYTSNSVNQSQSDYNYLYNQVIQPKNPEIKPCVTPLSKSYSAELQPVVTSSATCNNKSETNGKQTEDILSSTLENKQLNQQKLPVLKPKVLPNVDVITKDAQEIERIQAKDPLSDNSTLEKFIGEVQKFEKFVEGLTRKSLNGPTALDQKWKELLDTQDRESRKLAISVARCYPMKNRYPDVMPYDGNRVVLNSLKNDYINSSFVRDVTKNSVPYIVTQAPLPSSYIDFWSMVWEQQTEIIVCLLSSVELKSHVYWPSERPQPVTHGSISISLQSMKEKQCCTERILSISNSETRISRVVIHLQFTSFPANGVPATPSHLLHFIVEVHNYHRQQRNLARPIVIHCSGGIGRSGVFCLLSASVKETAAGRFPLDVAHIAARMNQQRKFLIQEKDHLKFCYDAVLYYAQDILMKRGILTNRARFEDKLPSQHTHTRHPSADFILGADGISKLQSGMAKLGLTDDPEKKNENAKNETDQQTDEVAVQDSSTSGRQADEDSVSKSEELGNLVPSTVIPATEAQTITSSSSITSLLDPATFTLDTTVSPNKKRITKDHFNTRSSSLDRHDPKDPLSQLDPLWSLKKM